MRGVHTVWDKIRHARGFLGPVLTLVSGTAAAHLLTACALVILARLFSPAEFGVLGLFTAIFFSLSVISCLRFDIAVALPIDEHDALALLVLSLISAVLIASAAVFLLAVTPPSIFEAMAGSGMHDYLWLLPVALLVSGILSGMQNWMVRRRLYASIARARVAQAAGAASVQIGAGLCGAGPIGLLIGIVFNYATGAAMMLRTTIADVRRLGGLPRLQHLKNVGHQYRRFPLYSTWEALANSLAMQLPILLVAALTNESELGQLMMALSVVQAPVALFGNATAQVYLSQAPEKARDGLLGSFTRKTVWHLFRFGALFMGAVAILAPWGFPILFGAGWERAGLLAVWMTPWLLLQFAYSPVSMVFHILGRQRLALAVQIAGLALRFGITWLGGCILAGRASEFYALSGAIFYGSAIVLILSIIPRKKIKVLRGKS
jgi:O-antigen/teichoic acid export membrane protein